MVVASQPQDIQELPQSLAYKTSEPQVHNVMTSVATMAISSKGGPSLNYPYIELAEQALDAGIVNTDWRLESFMQKIGGCFFDPLWTSVVSPGLFLIV